MKTFGTVVRGIKTPIIKAGDDLIKIVADSLLNAVEKENIRLQNRDVLAITEAVVGITEQNYASIDQIAADIQNKFGKDAHIGLVFPTPYSRNRFSSILRGIARGCKKITLLLSYPADEVGNALFDEELLYQHNINPWADTLTEQEYNKFFGGALHVFTGINYVKYFRELVEAENCRIEIVFSNRCTAILDYTRDVIVANIHKRDKTKQILCDAGAKVVYKTDELLRQSVLGSGYNSKYGLLGSNKATEDTVKLFPEHGDQLVLQIQEELKKRTGKTLEVMIYGDGAYKDPVGGIWELADPVVAPAFTPGLIGTPNEIKIKYISDTKLANLRGEALNEAMRQEIKNKSKHLKGSNETLGTTPRNFTDLLGSLADLASGSGDKGTPIVLIQNYFDNYAD